MDAARITQVRLTAFKSYRNQVLQLEPLTLLVGPNASGKSNGLDALALLALLAEERGVADLERGDEEVAGLRGGLTGAAPFGTNVVSLGCSIRAGASIYDLDVSFDVSNEPEVTSETLTVTQANRSPRTLISSTSRGHGEGIADVEVYSGGKPRFFQMLTSRLSVVQAMTKIPQDTQARISVVDACEIVTTALRGVFILDPVPGEMRGYPRIGALPNRLGSTTSAVVYGLQDDETAWGRLERLLKGLVGDRLLGITFVEARLPLGRAVDVMVALRESFAGTERLAPASVMSDGTLRYLSIVATLLSLGRNREDSAARATSSISSRTLVVEEVENGLYPTQAAAVLELLRQEAVESGVTLIASTHSPALLDALRPEDHPGVLVCGRDDKQRSYLTRLVDHANYLDVAGGGKVGTSVARGRLDASAVERGRFADLLGSS
jgi:AAA domain, putative AbiEii toxin, Type IV TA system/AAA domain